MKKAGIDLDELELIEKLYQAAQSGEISFTDDSNHKVTLRVTQTHPGHVSGDFGERDFEPTMRPAER